MGFRNPVTSAVDQTARDLANQALVQIIPGSRLAADAIDGRTITGAILQTGPAGPRMKIRGNGGLGSVDYVLDDNDTAPGGLTAYNAHDPDTGALSARSVTLASGDLNGVPGASLYLDSSGNIQLSGAAFTFPRVYAYLYTAVTDAYVSNWQDVYFRSEGAQQGGGFTAPGYRFIVPVAGDYEVSGQMTYGALPANTYFGARIFAGAPVPGSATLTRSSATVSDCTAETPTVTVTCAKGAAIGLQTYCGVNYSSRGTGATDGISPSLTIRKL